MPRTTPRTEIDVGRHVLPTALLVAVVAVVWFAPLGLRHLLPSDEGRYAEIAREMAATGDWTTIRYNGVKYFEKPPLHLWATALAYEIFGVGEWQARLWAAIAGLAGIGATSFAARRWYGPRTGWLAGLVLLAAPAWNLGGHFNSLDIGVAGALACVLACCLVAQHPGATPAARRGWMLAAWFAVAVGMLTKGLIGIVLPGLVLIVYSLAARDFGFWRRLALLPGIAIFLAVAAPWFVLVSVRNPEFPQFFFVHEHLQRYTSGIHRRTAPFWYFVPQLVAGGLPWIGLAFAAAARRRAAAPARTPTRAGPAPLRPRLLLATWAATIFVFFSLSNSKLPGYLLPVYPALAILAAVELERLDARGWRRQSIFMGAVAAIGLVATPFFARLGQDDVPNAVYRAYAGWAAAMFAFALAGVGLAWRWRARTDRMPSVAAAALGWFGAFTIGIVGHDAFGRASSGVDLVPPTLAALDTMRGPAPRDAVPIYAVRRLDHTLPFYLGHTTIMVEDADELAFGLAQEPGRWLPTLAAFETRWREPAPALAILAPDTFDRLVDAGLPMRVVARDVRRVVVANDGTGPR